ncbi:protein downstream neighbor of Son-like [Callorhinchus milii]|uniref:protein downstream neighbor of Son-like n=1 Tax=Callorhinchus milii TaxID=7868 RepID=UPI0004571B7A|nr:protein downstream neighbor of Son-like [Callorhinchus milii]|eukprot:gi/632970102/ref/XP_007901460.1/ PREDICTED: protein downstream neighbor of Son-like isoform X1 [Callorhinchus milii]
MVGTYCCVPGCFNNTLKNKELSFHVFPKNEQLRAAWIHHLARLDRRKFSVWQPKAHHKVCDAHFPGGKKTYMNNVPLLFPLKVERAGAGAGARARPGRPQPHSTSTNTNTPGQPLCDGIQFGYPSNIMAPQKRIKRKNGHKLKEDTLRRAKVPFTRPEIQKEGSVMASFSLNHQEGDDDEKARFEAAQTLLDIFKINSGCEGVQVTTVCEALLQINEKLNVEIACLKDEHRYLKAEYNNIKGELKRFIDGEPKCSNEMPLHLTSSWKQINATAESALMWPPVYSDCFTDWSIKTRILITSPTPFPWAKPNTKLSGTGCIHRSSVKPDEVHIKQEPDDSPALKCAFQQSMGYWMYPSLPWLQLFPRFGVNNLSNDNGLQWSPDFRIQSILMKDWLSTFRSLCELLQSGHCPFFYLCTYQFTVLFRAAWESRRESITALLYPASVEVLEAMRLSEVVFSIYSVEHPRENGKISLSSPVEHSSMCSRPGFLNIIEHGTKTVANSHLQMFSREIKTESQEATPNSDSSKNDRHQRYLGSQLKFLVVVEGPYAPSLTTFLMNTPHIAPQEGVQQGLPPTLLCPVAFPGASLQLLQVTNTSGKVQGCLGPIDSYSLEITGPILPHSMDCINRILQCSEYGRTVTVVNVHECTSAFNVHLPN